MINIMYALNKIRYIVNLYQDRVKGKNGQWCWNCMIEDFDKDGHPFNIHVGLQNVTFRGAYWFNTNKEAYQNWKEFSKLNGWRESFSSVLINRKNIKNGIS